MSLPIPTVLRTTALLAALMVLLMIGVFFATGVGQDPLQFVHPSAEYAALLLKDPPALRTALALDNLFIVFYTTMFLALGTVLRESDAPDRLLRVAIGLFLALGLLDLIENLHFMVMLAGAEQGRPPSELEISIQVLESLIKFHVSYLGLFLLGFLLPRRSFEERLLANLSWFVQLPVGILIYVSPKPIAAALVLVRFLYFLTALVLVARIFGRASGAAGSGARASSRDMTPSAAG